MPRMNRLGRLATRVWDTDQKSYGKDKCVQLYTTVIVRFNDFGIRLESGGWRTRMTLNRMNQASNQYGLAFKVVQRHGAWFVHYLDRDPLPFVDGMVIARDFIPTPQ